MRLMETIIRSHADKSWWENSFTLIEQIANEVPCYDLEFDLSGKAADIISDLLTA